MPASSEPVFDLAEAVNRLDGDREFLRELVTLFLETSPPLRAEIREAIARTDAPALREAAHALKGSVGNFAAEAAFEAAESLERIARSGELAGADPARLRLERVMERLTTELEHFLRDPEAT